MKEFTHNGHKIEMYASIEELPVTRFQDFNRLMLIDAGIGGDLDTADRHLSAILRYNAQGDREKLQKEVMNLRQNLAFTMANISPEMGAFFALVKSIDGKPIEDLSEDGIRRATEMIAKKGITRGQVKEWMKDVKKKLTKGLRSFSRHWSIAPRSGNTIR